jgi:hypothetical protein
MKCTRIGGKRCNCSCFEIDQEMDAILLIICIVYGVCRIVIKSVQQCTYFLFSIQIWGHYGIKNLATIGGLLLSPLLTECESSCQDVSNLFDQVEKQCKTNTKNIIHFDSRIKKLEEKSVVQPVVESEEIKSLKESVPDLKCCSMKNNLIFTGLNRVQNEDTEDLLRGFLHHELEINYRQF